MMNGKTSKSPSDELAEQPQGLVELPGDFADAVAEASDSFREFLIDFVLREWCEGLTQARAHLRQLVAAGSVVALARLLRQDDAAELLEREFWRSNVPIEESGLCEADLQLLKHFAEAIGRQAGRDDTNDHWTDDKNARRCELIDREIAGRITETEKVELDSLQNQMRRHLDRVAPFPVEGARRLHQRLLRKQQESRGQD